MAEPRATRLVLERPTDPHQQGPNHSSDITVGDWQGGGGGGDLALISPDLPVPYCYFDSQLSASCQSLPTLNSEMHSSCPPPFM